MIEALLLGPLEVRVDGRAAAPGAPKQRAVCAALLLSPGTVVSVDRLIEVVWAHDPPASAVTKIQGYVSAVRKSLAEAGLPRPAEVLATRAPGYVLRAGSVDTDVTRFESLVAEAGRARTRRDPAAVARLLGPALGLWRGAALADVGTGPALLAEAERLAEVRLTAVEDKAAANLALGRYREVLAGLDRHLAQHPYRERIRELRMRALIGLDCPAEALACYENGRRILRAELGVEPSGRLRRLASAISGGVA
ncbi:AfsR/SARP family transcriptional regulator [Actinospica robiniae]|uniref:AfsR/SARP family transcriptional regulator n=1 Tax=Actinospica robiniae TaxID=304901 RepID=UPI00068450D2|nr:AfsR/SARP family transcriptional regulator [Actinospica robiniae]